jgi:hypothetical protein
MTKREKFLKHCSKVNPTYLIITITAIIGATETFSRWRTTHCRLSATAYSIYSQLPSISEAVTPSATWGRAMPWWQGLTCKQRKKRYNNNKNKTNNNNNVYYIGCPRKNVPDFGRVFLMLNYTDITQNTYIQSWTGTEIMAREVWNFDSWYTLTDYQTHIKTYMNMWFL